MTIMNNFPARCGSAIETVTVQILGTWASIRYVNKDYQVVYSPDSNNEIHPVKGAPFYVDYGEGCSGGVKQLMTYWYYADSDGSVTVHATSG